MPTVPSKDGTPIAYVKDGTGPAVILVSGALGTKAAAAGLIEHLRDSYTLYAYDRRGRVDSGDTQPYAVEREIEDMDAVIDAAGGKAALYGMSSGGILCLHVANALPDKVTRVFLYEPPLIVDSSRQPLPDDYVEQLHRLIDAGKRSETLEYFLSNAVGIPAPAIEGMKHAPMWKDMEAVAHTIRYDGEVVGSLMSGTPIPANRWPNITAPVRVVIGGNSEPFFQKGADAIVANLPGHADTIQLPNQDHNVDPAKVAVLVKEFLGEKA